MEDFVENIQMEAEQFENAYMSLNDGATFTRMLRRNDIANE